MTDHPTSIDRLQRQGDDVAAERLIADHMRLARMQRLLLEWFREQRSDLPWRRTSDPYAILVSEFMLQQTQRERVAPKFLAFLDRFPTLEALAAAPASAVIRAWSGLGYNNRAIRLQAIARRLASEGRQLPSDVDELRALPGVGPYTAVAVACFGFGRQVATVDTNVRRVLRRALCGESWPEAKPAYDARLASEALPVGEAFAWNSALMDLGARICLARVPRCRECPLLDLCHAALSFAGEPARRPGRLVADQPAGYAATSPRRRPAYAASDRFLRGRIVDALRLLPEGDEYDLPTLALAATGMALPPQNERVSVLAERLVAEGLIVARDGEDGRRFRLPD